MVSLYQVRPTWSGWAGGPGVSTFYFRSIAGQTIADVKAFFEAVKVMIPNAITITYPNTGMVIDSSTGQATGTWSTTQVSATACTGTGTWAAPAGSVVNWKTGLFVNGRELRGKTFLVPFVSGTFDTDGSLNNTNRTTIENAANALRATGDFLTVYSRATTGTAPVVSATVPDKVVVLRSRRA